MTRLVAFVAGGVALAAAFTLPTGPAAAADALTPAQKSAVEDLVRDYILNNPETMIESLRSYEEKQRVSSQQDVEKAIIANRDALERDPSSPVAGNPKGDVTIVEFFDYRCGYCKKALPVVQELLKTDPKVRYVFRDLPILGKDSVIAAQAALAAWNIAPEKYLAFHVALMESRGELSEARVLETAKKVGLDPDKIKAAMDSPEIKAKLERSYELARILQVNGTPAFIIGGKLVPGAVDLETMREMVKTARAG